MTAALQRAQMLLAQSRYELAEKELRRGLAEDPDDPTLHAMLAICLSEQKTQRPEALASARRAVSLSPDASHVHYVLASVLHDQDQEQQAESAAREAIRLDPEDPDNFSMLAAILLDRRQWKDALSTAETGLALDAEDIACNNIRALALTKLGRRKEAGATIRQALARDPENAVTHANMGWTCLEDGETKPAMEHFREALRLDPDSEWARAGIVEALRARHFLYRIVLKYFFWMSRLSGRAQWGVIIGLYVAFRLLRGVEKSRPELGPYVQPFLYLYLAFFVMTWMARPLFNLLLRLNRFGRLALSDRETSASNWVGALLLGGLGFLGLYAWTASFILVLPAVYCLAMLLPVNAAISATRPRTRRLLLLYTIGLAILGPLAIVMSLIMPGAAGQWMLAFVLGWVGFQWFANFVAIRS